MEAKTRTRGTAKPTAGPLTEAAAQVAAEQKTSIEDWAATFSVGAAVDELGAICADISNLQEKEQALKAAVKMNGPGAYEGQLFRATVTASVQRRLDMEAVRGKLTPQFIKSHTIETPVVSVRVVARNGRDI